MYLFFDTETTGLPKNWGAPTTDADNWPRIVQLAYIFIDNQGYESVCNRIIKPEGFIIPEEASNIHGITTERALKEGIPLAYALGEFIEFMRRANLLVAHNMSFDRKILEAELYRVLGYEPAPMSIQKFCTMTASTSFCQIQGPRGYKWPKLQELHQKLFGSEFIGAHDALEDIRATVKCFFELQRLKVIEV